MKKDIHPTYYPDAKVSCACGNSFTVGATIKSMEIESCNECHAAYTGKQTGTLRGGRIERFKKRLEKQEKLKSGSTKKAKS